MIEWKRTKSATLSGVPHVSFRIWYSPQRMASNNKSLLRTLLRVIAAILITHLLYYFLVTILFNSANGFEAIGRIPLILVIATAAFILITKMLTGLGVKIIILGLAITVATLFLIETFLHPGLFNSNGSTMESANLFVPSLMWDNDFEYLKIYPVTYLVSIVFNYALIVISILVSKKLIDRE